MSDFDYRMDDLESRISSCEDDLRSQISSERYETEREISNVESRIRSTGGDLSELNTRVQLQDSQIETLGGVVGNLLLATEALDKRLEALVTAAELQEHVCKARSLSLHKKTDVLSRKCGVTT